MATDPSDNGCCLVVGVVSNESYVFDDPVLLIEHFRHPTQNFVLQEWVFMNSTDKFIGVIVGSMRTTNQHGTESRNLESDGVAVTAQQKV
ncbi:hypothetical protein TNCV_1323161 [Trichonephila clavipes]|nr:hypothetical protein TNCV_1323161 [Trichonephila clavipes]